MKTKTKILGCSIVCVVAIAMMLSSGCTHGPNQKDGIIELAGATGSIAVSPGDFKTLKEKIPISGNGVSRSYSKSGDKETVKLTGEEGNTVVFETGPTAGIANIRIKGNKRFVEKMIAKTQQIIGAEATITHHKLIAETVTYAGVQKSHLPSLEEKLGKTMTALGRSTFSMNNMETITLAFEKDLNGVRMKYSEKSSSLRVTIEGNREFVDGIKSLLNKIKKTN